MMAASTQTGDLKATPLTALHESLGGRLVPFAGYGMPVQFEGIIAEHLWTRQKAGLFDVSHMGQRFLSGPDHETTAQALEALTPGAFQSLGAGRMRYTLLLNEAGGILDDLIVTRSASPDDDGKLMLVVNAGRKDADDAHLAANLPAGVEYVTIEDRALLALQGPAAAEVLAGHCARSAGLTFMTATSAEFALPDGSSIDCHVSRSGYTGEDGFELSVPAAGAEAVARALLNHDLVKPIGLGARDSLRLEAGLPLYGHDLDETTSPVEAGLGFAIARARREAGAFPGAKRILRELAEGPARKLAGIAPSGRAPVRQGAQILSPEGAAIGVVTSGGFGPTIGGPVAMGYVNPAFSGPGSEIQLTGRRGPEPAIIAALPFVPHNYVRAAK
jgi:aminomethyltransferase